MLKLSVIAVVLGLVAGAGLLYLPNLRKDSWQETKTSSRLSSTAVMQAAEEGEIRDELGQEFSEFDERRDVRTLSKVPATPAALEAAYRKHRNDVCEPLQEGVPMVFDDFTLALTPRDSFRSKELVFPSTRRQVLTVGLTMLAADEKALPTLSRSTITSFLEDHYLSIQARITKDPTTDEWALNYRPIAAVGSFRGSTSTQDWVHAISMTVNDICGLGLLKSGEDEPTQTAVLLFRSTWMDPVIQRPKYRHELGFLHAVKAKNPKEGEDPFELHLVITSDERTKWHYIETSSSRPSNPSQCGLVGSIYFNTFLSNGLEPKSAVTRRISTKSDRMVDVSRIEQYLKEQNLSGGWQENTIPVVKAMIDGTILTN